MTRSRRKELRLLLPLVLSPLAIGASAAQRAAPEAASACPCTSALGSWSEPRTIDGVYDGQSLRWPSLSLRGDTTYVTGTFLPIRADAPVAPRPLVVLRLPGSALPAPAGDHLFAYPKGVHDASGRYHLFWADRTESDRRSGLWPYGPLTSLWHSAFDGRGWSPPRELVRGARVDWGAEGGAAAAGAGDRLHLVVPVVGDDGRLSLRYLRKTDRGWEARVFPAAAAYASITTSEPEHVQVAYTAPDTSVRSDGNSVFVMSSPDGGTSWNAPVLVSRSGRRAATAPVILHASGVFHLIWAQSTSGAAGPQVLRHMWSRGVAADWQALPDVPLPGDQPLQFHVAADRCGSIRAVVESFHGQRMLLHEISWREGWFQVEQLFPGFEMAASAGLAAAGCDFRLVGSVLRRPDDDAVAVLITRDLPLSHQATDALNTMRSHPAPSRLKGMRAGLSGDSVGTRPLTRPR